MRIDELSDKAQEHAYDDWLEDLDFDTSYDDRYTEYDVDQTRFEFFLETCEINEFRFNESGKML
jgi:hypothetical protein